MFKWKCTHEGCKFHTRSREAAEKHHALTGHVLTVEK